MSAVLGSRHGAEYERGRRPGGGLGSLRGGGARALDDIELGGLREDVVKLGVALDNVDTVRGADGPVAAGEEEGGGREKTRRTTDLQSVKNPRTRHSEIVDENTQ